MAGYGSSRISFSASARGSTAPSNPQDAAEALCAAAAAGDVLRVRSLLQSGVDVNVVGADGFTALHEAAAHGSTEVVLLLLSGSSLGPSFSPASPSTATAEAAAAAAGGGKAAAAAAAAGAGRGADTRLLGPNCVTALHLAASHGFTDIVRHLLAAGAPVNAACTLGLTPLHAAAHHGHNSAAAALLSAGADIHAASKEGHTPLLTAAYFGHSSMVSLLLSEQADVHAADTAGRTALHHAACRGHERAASVGNLAIARLLLAAQADVNRRGFQDATALHTAAASGNMEMLQLLLAAGADVHLQNSHGATALHAAASTGQTAAAAALLAAGAHVSGGSTGADSKRWAPPLHIAVHKGHCDMVRLLLSHMSTRAIRASFTWVSPSTAQFCESAARVSSCCWMLGCQ